jgi:hypothetical protein
MPLIVVGLSKTAGLAVVFEGDHYPIEQWIILVAKEVRDNAFMISIVSVHEAAVDYLLPQSGMTQYTLVFHGPWKPNINVGEQLLRIHNCLRYHGVSAGLEVPVIFGKRGRLRNRYMGAVNCTSSKASRTRI